MAKLEEGGGVGGLVREQVGGVAGFVESVSEGAYYLFKRELKLGIGV